MAANVLPEIHQHQQYNYKTLENKLEKSKLYRSRMDESAMGKDSDPRYFRRSFPHSQSVARSIDKYYKTNDVTDILGKDTDYYPKHIEADQKVNPNKEVSENLLKQRKMFNGTRNDTNNFEKQIQQMRAEIEQMKNKELILYGVQEMKECEALQAEIKQKKSHALYALGVKDDHKQNMLIESIELLVEREEPNATLSKRKMKTVSETINEDRETKVQQLQQDLDRYSKETFDKTKLNEITQTLIKTVNNVEDTLMNRETYEKLNGLEGKNDIWSQKLDDVIMQSKTYQHMLRRMKSDLQCYKYQLNNKEESLNLGHSVLVSAGERQQKFQQKSQKARLALDDVVRNMEKEQKERERNLTLFKNDVTEKQDLEKAREERIKRQKEIEEVAANDCRDSNFKKWRKLLLVHNFLSIFLKKKMEREMKRFESVEVAFQKIKAATGVSEAGEIVHKFLNREHTYSHLLISIADQEKKIDNLRKSNETLEEKLQRLIQENQPLEKSEKNQKKEVLESLQKYDEISEKAKYCKRIQEESQSWMIRSLMKLERAAEVEVQSNKKEFTSQEDVLATFQQIVKLLKENLLSLNEQDADKVITDFYKNKSFEDGDLTEYNKRNIRIKPLKVLQQPPDESKFMGNLKDSMEIPMQPQESYDNLSEILQEDNSNMIEEAAYMRNMRDEIKASDKSNIKQSKKGQFDKK